MANSNITQNEREIFINALSEIGSDAHEVMALCTEAINHGSDMEASAQMTVAARIFAANIGMLADLVLKHMGDPGVIGGPEEWFLSPAMRVALYPESPFAKAYRAA